MLFSFNFDPLKNDETEDSPMSGLKLLDQPINQEDMKASKFKGKHSRNNSKFKQKGSKGKQEGEKSKSKDAKKKDKKGKDNTTLQDLSETLKLTEYDKRKCFLFDRMPIFRTLELFII